MRAHAWADAAAALKRAEMQKIKEFQIKSALDMNERNRNAKKTNYNVALERKKRKEEAHLELLRTGRESVITAAPEKAIGEELGFEHNKLLSHLPVEEPSNCVRNLSTASFGMVSRYAMSSSRIHQN